MNMKQSIFFCLLILLTSCGGSDTPTEIENNQSIAATKSKYEFQLEDACGFDKTMVNETVYSFDSDMQADNALKRVMRLTGLPANFEIRAASVPNAAAVIKCDRNGNNCNRYILYNQEFMEKVKDETKTNYAELAILAHEIAHHLSGHTISNTGSSYDMELEADKFAGFMLYKMGASLAETKQSFSNLPTQGSSSHPPRSARLAAVTNGWYEAKRNGETISTPTSSTNEQASNNQLRNKPSSRNKSSLKVGSSYLGGLIYEINSSGTHGKVVKIIEDKEFHYFDAMSYIASYNEKVNSEFILLPSESDYKNIQHALYNEFKDYFTYEQNGYTRDYYWIANSLNKRKGGADLFRFKKNNKADMKVRALDTYPLLVIRNF